MAGRWLHLAGHLLSGQLVKLAWLDLTAFPYYCGKYNMKVTGNDLVK